MCFLNHLGRLDISSLTFWSGPFKIKRVSGYFLLLLCFIEIPVFNANCADSDETPRSGSDLDIHCLTLSLL